MEHSFVGAGTWDNSESRSGILGEFWNAVMEKDEEDQLDQPCEKWENIAQSQEGIFYKQSKDGSLNGLVTYCVGNAF